MSEQKPIEFFAIFYIERERLSDLSKYKLYYERQITVKIINPQRCSRLEIINGCLYHTCHDVTQEINLSADLDSQFGYGVSIEKSTPKRVKSNERYRELIKNGAVVYSDKELSSICALYQKLGME